MSNGSDGNETPQLSPPVVSALSNGRVAEAIRLLRDERGIGVQEATDLVGRYLSSQPALKRKLDAQQAEAMRGCLLWLAGLIALATVAYFVVTGR